MEEILKTLQSLVPADFDYANFLKAALLLCIGSLVLGFLGRMIFGKRSVLNQSVSSSIGILFIYAATIAIYSYGVDLGFLLSPLPFVSLSGEYLQIFSFLGADYTVICEQVLSMIILDKTDAADLIPEDAQGRFLLHEGTMFQAYWYDDTGGI